MRVMVFIFSMFLIPALNAMEVEGVKLDEKVSVGKSQLVLNGAGVRSKFIVDVYVGALYLPAKNSDEAAVIKADTPNRIAMHFLYSKVKRADAVEAWNEGFAANLTADELSSMKVQIDAFNAMFPDLRKGDSVYIDYQPGKGTSVIINGKHKGSVKGAAFNRAVQSIWLGKKPVTKDLKKAMLGR